MDTPVWIRSVALYRGSAVTDTSAEARHWQQEQHQLPSRQNVPNVQGSNEEEVSYLWQWDGCSHVQSIESQIDLIVVRMQEESAGEIITQKSSSLGVRCRTEQRIGTVFGSTRATIERYELVRYDNLTWRLEMLFKLLYSRMRGVEMPSAC